VISVVAEQAAKSIGHEETFASDIWDRDELRRRLMRMVDAAATNLRQADLAARTVGIKVRFADFAQITRSHSMNTPIDAAPAVAAVAEALLDSVELNKGVRLLGVSLAGFGHPDVGLQLSLDLDSSTPGARDGPSDRAGSRRLAPSAGDPLVRAHDEAERIQRSWGSVTNAVDAIRARYGGSSVGPASLVGADGLQVRRRGEAQWGPTGTKSPSVDAEGPASL